MTTQKLTAPLLEDLALRLHGAWRKVNSGKEVFRATTDEQWKRTHAHSEMCLLSDCSYDDLPVDLKEEVRAAAQSAVEVVFSLASEIGTEVMLDHASARVHDEWLNRNKGRALSYQRLCFNDLSDNEKEKDRIFVRETLTFLKENGLL